MARGARVAVTLLALVLACCAAPVSSGAPTGAHARPTVRFASSRRGSASPRPSASARADDDAPWFDPEPPGSTPPFTEAMRAAAAAEVRRMFHHGYDSYLRHAFPHDELKPLTKTYTDSLGELGNLRREHLSSSYRGVALTLIDATSTLAVLGNASEFAKNVRWMSRHLNFDQDVRVNAFECNIRALGGLLSAHAIAAGLIPRRGERDGSVSADGFARHSEGSTPGNASGLVVPGYAGELLELAHDLGSRLLRAFDTETGMPYAWVNLRTGVRFGETAETNVAAVGSYALEFGALSRMTGDWRFERASKRAIKALWSRRSDRDLLGNTINVKTGRWINRSGGIGAGCDSFFEYLVKAHVAFGDAEALDIFGDAYVAVMRWYHDDGWYHEAHLDSGAPTHMQATSLQAFWPGVQVMLGDLDSAKHTWSRFFALWRRFGAQPERFLYADGTVHPSERQYPLRPELVESTALLFAATKDDAFRHAGARIARDLVKNHEVPGGYAAMRDVRLKTTEDHQPSFFLAETVKYLYLLFDDPGGFLSGARDAVFTTEGHPLPVFLASDASRRDGADGADKADKADGADKAPSRRRLEETPAEKRAFDVAAVSEAASARVARDRAVRASARRRTPPGVVDRDADLDAPYRARWPDPARALSSDPSLRGAGFGLTSRTCPNPGVVRADAVSRIGGFETLGANEPGSPVDVPVVHFARVRGFVDDSDGERTEVWETASAPGEVSSAPSPAERLAALSRRVEAMHRDVARNRDALRAMEAHAASERVAGE
jgi:mannosidase alpha-like ER degradation enhancer 1